MVDGTQVFLRPLKLTDESLLRALFYRLSPESIHYRFFQLLKSMPHDRLQEFLRIDYEADMAFVVLTSAMDEDAEMVGIAHYLRDPRSNFAEAAFLVRDDWQGRGVGTRLMAALVDAARRCRSGAALRGPRGEPHAVAAVSVQELKAKRA